MASSVSLQTRCLIKVCKLLNQKPPDSSAYNPFAHLPHNLVDNLIYTFPYEGKFVYGSHLLYYLLTSGQVRQFVLQCDLFEMKELKTVLTYLSSSCENLCSFHLKYTRLQSERDNDELSRLIDNIISKARSLKSVTLPCSFNFEVLKECSKLEKLSIAMKFFTLPDEWAYKILNVDDCGQVIPNYSLKEIDIGYNYSSYLDIAIMLKHCKQLVYINHSVTESLEYLHTEELYNGTLKAEYKLLKCNLDDATGDAVHIASITCPFVEDLVVTTDDIKAFDALQNFQHLSSLSIYMTTPKPFSAIQFLLENSVAGCKLTKLDVSAFMDFDFEVIAKCCPNLRLLKLENVSVVGCYVSALSSFRKLWELDIGYHKLHKSYKLNETDLASQRIALLNVLSATTNLKILTVLFAQSLNDDLLEEILKRNNFSSLKDLYIYGSLSKDYAFDLSHRPLERDMKRLENIRLENIQSSSRSGSRRILNMKSRLTFLSTSLWASASIL